MRIYEFKENNLIISEGGIYFLYDKDLELLYIGKSKNIKLRILQHTTKNENSRLQIGDKGTPLQTRYCTCIPYGVIKYYGYIIEEDKFKRGIIECFLLSIMETKFNKSDKIKAIRDYLRDNNL